MEKTMKERIMHRLTGALTVALAVFVLLVCWVVCTRQQAGAVNAGTYYVSVDTWAKSTESCWATLYYTKQDGSTGSQSLYVTNDKTWRRDQHYALSGYPTAVRMFTHGNPTSYGEVNVAVYVSPNSDYTTDRICLMNYAKIDVGYIGGADGDYTYHIDTNSYEQHSSHGSDYSAGNHYWPGVGIKDIVYTAQQKRTYRLNANGSITGASSWSSTTTNAVQLDGKTYHEYMVKAYARDKFGVRIGNDPEDVTMSGTCTYDSTPNYSGLAVTDTISRSDYSEIYAVVEPDAHLSGQNRNRQSVKFETVFSYNNDTKSKSFSFTVTDESYTTKFYDRTGTLRTGSANISGPALTDTDRRTFATATNSSGVQYSYYGDRVIPPFNYTGTDNASTRFDPLAYGSNNATALAAATEAKENFHYKWKGWAVALDIDGNMTTSAVPVNNANTFGNAYTGPAARYEEAVDNYILVESFDRQRHTPSQIEAYTWQYSAATCTADAKYYKVCSDPVCRFKFTRKGQGALGQDVDHLWINYGSQLNHNWRYTPDGAECKGHSTTATAYAETCATTGSNGYYYCSECQKYFSHLKTDDSTDEEELFVKDEYGYDTDVPMSRPQVIAYETIPALGHNYAFKGWVWGEGSDGQPDYTKATGSFECTNGASCTETTNKVHSFTIYTNRAPTSPNSLTAVKNSSVRITETTRDATCIGSGIKTYLAAAGSVIVTVTTPEGDVLDPEEIDFDNLADGESTIDYPQQLKATVTLPALGHDFRGECIGDSKTYNKKTGTYGAHTFRCVRCNYTGINTLYDENNNVIQTITNGTEAHNASTAVESSATCQNYAVCAVCHLPFGDLAPHDFSDTSLIQSADPESTADDPVGINEYQGHYYACAYGCGTYGVMVPGEEGNPPTAAANGTVGHVFDEGQLLRPATCTVNGRRVYTCTAPGCGFKHYTTMDPDLQATGHDYTGQPITLSSFKTGDNYNTTMTASVTCKNANCGKYNDAGNLNPVQTWNTVTETVDIVATPLPATCTTDGRVTRTATFTDPAFNNALLDGEPFAKTRTDTSEVLSATGHNWVNVSVVWSADHSTCTGSAECANDPDHNVTQSAIVTSRTIDNPTCTEPGTAKFTAVFEDEEGNELFYDTYANPNRSFQDIYNQNNMDATGVIPATGHNWTDFTYTWLGNGDEENDFTGVNARCVCSSCRTRVNETGTVDRAQTNPTCEEDGSIVWSVTFTHDFFSTEPQVLVLNRLGHAYDYDNIKYSSTRISGGWRFTARVTCLNDSTHVISESMNGEVSTVAPTCTTKGRTTYTADFTDPHFETQTKVEETPALGHAWGQPVITWDQDPDTLDYTAAHGVIVCANDETHTKEEDCTNVEKTIKKKPTCEETGLAVYTARFSREIGTQNKSRQLAKLEHELGEIRHGTPNTCAVEGFRDYRVCDKCGKYFVEEPIGSDNWVETTNAGLILSPSSEHKDENGDPYVPVDLPAQAATCVAVGNKAVSYCPGCKLIFSIDGVSTYTTTEDGVEVQKPLTEMNYRYGKDKAQYELAKDPANHTDLVKTEGVPATCESVGTLEHWYCSGCDKYFSNAEGTTEITKASTVLPIAGHDYDFEHAEYSWSANHGVCVAVAVCRNNPEHILREEAQSVKNVIEPATCTTDGECSFSATFENEGFGTKTTEEMVDSAIGHDWDVTGELYKPAYNWTDNHSACIATVYCKNDKNHSKDYAGTVEEDVQIQQDCDVDGKVVYTATFTGGVKSDSKTVIFPKTQHEWDYTGETYNVDYDWSPDRSRCTAVVHCTKNPEHTKEITVIADLIVIKKSTCTEDGKGVYEAIFGYGIPKDTSDQVVLAKSGHNAKRIPATPATCLEKGVYAHYYCNQCGRYFNKIDCRPEDEIPAASVIQEKIPHDLIRHQAIEPNCTTGGCPEYWTCAYCGKYFLSETGSASSETTQAAVTLPANGHKWVKRPGQEPTCTEAGWEIYDYCLRCQTVENYVSIPATGHGDFVYDYVHSSVSADGSVRWDVYSCGRGCGSFYANISVTLRDKNNKGVQGAVVTITNNHTGKVAAAGTTDAYGEFNPTAKFSEGNYKITVSYEDANNTFYATSTMTFYTDENGEANVIPAKIGKTDFVPSSNSGSGSGSGSGSSQSTTPSNVCKWCGQVHTGFFGKITQFFHNILVLFSR